MKKKYLEGTDWSYVSLYEAYHYKTSEGLFSLVEFVEVPFHIPVDYDESNKSLLDDMSKGVMFIPNNDYSASVVYNKNLIIQEWYFDMIDSCGYHRKPFMMDLYLDVAVSPEGHVALLDEDELIEAYDKGLITKLHVDKAYKTSDYIINELTKDDQFMTSFFNDLLQKMLEEKNAIKGLIKYDLKQPLFYNYSNSLRFEIAVSDLKPSDYILKVLTLFNTIFSKDDDIMMIINCYEDHDLYDCMDHNHCLKLIKENLYEDDGLSTQYIYPLKVVQINHKKIFERIINNDLGLKPSTDSDVYFVQLEKDIVFHLYDDRGLDITGNTTILKSLFKTYKGWLLEYDMDSMLQFS